MFAIFRISTFTPTTRSWTGSAAPHPSASLRSASAMMRCVGSGCPVRRGAVRGSQTSKQLPRSLLALHHLGSNSGRPSVRRVRGSPQTKKTFGRPPVARTATLNFSRDLFNRRSAEAHPFIVHCGNAELQRENLTHAPGIKPAIP